MDRFKSTEMKTKLDLNLESDPHIFEEEQRFEQWWLWLLMAGGTAAVVIPFIIQLLTGNPIGNDPAPTIVLGLVSMMMMVLLFMFSTLKLKTYIDQDRIKMSYKIFGSKDIPWSEVEKVDVVNYGFVGYGMRFSRNHGIVYNVDGKYGLFITLKNGKKFTIGTQKKEELEEFLGVIGRGLM